MPTMQVVYQVAKHNYIRLVRKLVFIRLHVGLQVSGVYPLTGGRQTRNLAITPVMSANLMPQLYYIFTEMSNLFPRQTSTPSTSHKLKHGDLREDR